ncbi:MAG: tripartite tricarboxylate transporter substrate binding protein [Reyranella sp.]|uniref:Bug family tripartite tricarboxylate transporter substrate binding protein n=1 Tax=Reyranella sp. TaxID=1929291 RepID=UPI0025D514A6|nr:tripartite tricarboxylate transporter substrate binding protein [Reyranella sp.]MBR2814562.1 tripartite tricarboxylate transporter substrate binding protein [Reyranella sp.]
MSRLRRRTALTGSMAAGIGAVTQRAFGADWPARPVSWIVPFPPAGGSDMFARPIAAHVGDRLHQSMVVENKPGAGGTIGTAIAARAAADGYSLLVGDTGLIYAPTVYPKAGFDFVRDFAPIAAFGRVPYVLVVNPARLPAANLDAFIALAKAKPGLIDVGSAGLGTITHLAIGLFEDRAGIELNHVPYRGGAPMLQDLLAGQIAAAFALATQVAGNVASGKLRALAVANRRRDTLLPDVPTMHEAGLAEFRMTTWFGLFAPRGTPDEILDRLHGAVQGALVSDDVRRQWAEQGAKVELESRAEFADFIRRESERWNRIAKAANVQME